jgi:elongation factor G
MDRLRTFGIVAHIDAGKTTLTERILFDTGAQGWIGNVDDGTAAMDWLPEERSRGISVQAAATRVQWGEHVLQIVDTPGHVDFVAEVERCMHVLDGVVVVVDGVRGVESQTEAVWEQASARGLGRIVFVNKMDRAGADFAAVVDELRERLSCQPLPVVVPLFDDHRRFAGLGDAVTGAVQWFDGRPDGELATSLGVALRQAHDRLVEVASLEDDEVLADALAGRRSPTERLQRALRAGFAAGRLVPVLAGAALWNRGVDWLLDAVVAYLPRLSDLPRTGLWAIERAGDPTAPFCGLCFKVQHVDTVWNFVRVVRGRLVAGGSFATARRPAQVRTAAELWLVRASRHEATAAAGPGEICVLPGDLGLATGDTLCAADTIVELEAPRFPAPVLAVVFEPHHAADLPALAAALREIEADDPTLRVERTHDRLVVHGMGELHLEIVADRARARSGVAFHCSRPDVDRRETIAAPATSTAEVRVAVAGRERAARCTVALAPVPGAAPAVVLDRVGTAASAAACEELRLRAAAGTQVGPLHGCRVELVALDGDGDAEALVQQAAAKALAGALEQAQVQQLEPWVQIEVHCPVEATNPVMADLAARSAAVSNVTGGRSMARLEARAPLSRMLGYVTKLRSMTKGRGQVSMRPVDYAPVP